jgi:predicted restriction endonuclease
MHGLTRKHRRNTMGYIRNGEQLAAIRVTDKSIFSLPENYWNQHPEEHHRFMSSIPSEYIIPLGNSSSKESSGQVEINDETIELIRKFIDEEISEREIDIDKKENNDNEGFKGRKILVVNRILRDTEKTKKIKLIHNWQCQICGLTLEVPGGLKYAEGHHIKPIGMPHNGPDIEENIICVCPNHHALLDYGSLKLNSTVIRNFELSPINQEYIDYHNKNILKPIN